MLIDQLPPDSHWASLSQTLPDAAPLGALLFGALVPTRTIWETGFRVIFELTFLRLVILPLCRTTR